MGKEKGGFLTPKAIANRIKSKGLSKLRWYCQMCMKQCRDENGFKCHTMSESHQRQLLIFAESPDEFIDSFSKEFEDGYTELLRRRFGTKRVHANIVYQEYIGFKEHLHMNATQWETLTEFVKYLGREGKAVVDETEKGWFVQHIDRDPETIKKQEAVKNKEKMDLDDDERTAKYIEEQVRRAAATAKEIPKTEFTELKRESEEDKVKINFGSFSKKSEETVKPKTIAPSTNPLASKRKDVFGSERSGGAKKRKSALDEIMEFEEKHKEKSQRKDHWLHPDIVVKIMTKRLGDKYYKKKAVVKEVINNYTAVIRLLDSNDKLKIDQTHLETVIPALGKPVLIVNGAYRGHTAVITELDEKRFCCTVKLSAGPLNGRVIEGVQYEDISKSAS